MSLTQRVVCLDPIAGLDAEVLVLGTLPGPESIASRQYYASANNAFWRILEELGVVSASSPYSERTARLIERKVALWDVLAAATRPSSSDSSIIPGTEVPNNFRHFLGIQRHLRVITFNGLPAETYFNELVVPTLDARWQQIPRITLPSTSGANTHLDTAGKVNAWSVLAQHGCVA